VNRSNPAAIPYAQALIEIGQDEGLLGRIREELGAVQGLVEESRDFRLFFLSPSIDPEHKHKIVSELLGDRLCRTMLGFLDVLFRKKREPLLDNIRDQFIRFEDESENRIRVQVKSATLMADDLLETLKNRITAASGKTVALETSVDSKLLGGAVIRVGDRLVDGSVRSRLRKLRKELRSGGHIWAQEVD
jgi:F-type H+-transporting ATPase subunit delta